MNPEPPWRCHGYLKFQIGPGEEYHERLVPTAPMRWSFGGLSGARPQERCGETVHAVVSSLLKLYVLVRNRYADLLEEIIAVLCNI